ncbi:response regulator [Saccharospirillum salsuginis]|uniref:Response regulator n=1 Tax=Saccharospirillum salsuginis TaxID=418750 RepID=A0A918KW36_9GAMM|nr:response regulator [Saccharospirillum salsuginis]GGX75893.1 response regulator [Saccharospirillum salsuginis]
MSLETILYVEDDPDIRAIAELALVSVGGFRLVPCSGGQEALDVLEDTRPDLILLDVMMPSMDGPETLRAIRRQPALADIPIVFMTAKVQPDEVEDYLDMGALGVIAKPFDPMTLADQVRTLWQRSRG